MNNNTIEKIAVAAPPGKLGLLISNRSSNNNDDNNKNNKGEQGKLLGTFVYGLRPNSPLLHKLCPGDIIVGIDNENVSQMDLDEVMDLLGAKCHQEERIIHIWRTTTKTPTSRVSKKQSISGGSTDSRLSSLPSPDSHYQDVTFQHEEPQENLKKKNIHIDQVAINIRSSKQGDQQNENIVSSKDTTAKIPHAEIMVPVVTPTTTTFKDTSTATGKLTTRNLQADTQGPNTFNKDTVPTSSRSSETKQRRMSIFVWIGILILIIGIVGAVVAILTLKSDSSDNGDSESSQSNVKMTFRFTTGTLYLAESAGPFEIQLRNNNGKTPCSSQIETPPGKGMSKSFNLICPEGTHVSPMTLIALTDDAWYIEDLEVQINGGTFIPMTPTEIWCDKEPYDDLAYYAGKPYQAEIQYETTTMTLPSTGSQTTILPTTPSQTTLSPTTVAPTPPKNDGSSSTEVDALLSLYTDTDGINWENNENWGSIGSVCDWYGVSCNPNGYATRLSLYGNNLNGTISTEIFDLVFLTSLDLSNNNLVGTLPAGLGTLTFLNYLSIYMNGLHGKIPSQLGQLTDLTGLLLFGNDLTGHVPTELGHLSNLGRLVLSTNELSGPIPSQLGQLTKLTWLTFHYGELTGTLPTEIGRMINMVDLDFGHNLLSGTIPTQLQALTNIEELHLGGNLIEDSIPSWIGTFSTLRYLSLSVNSFYGRIPTELGKLSNLENLHLWSNNLSGRIPSELGQLQELEWLWIGNNNFNGSIPSELQNLVMLDDLYLSGNDLTGSIPTWLGILKFLESIELDNNDFTFGIPSQLGLLTLLSDLHLSNNNKLGGTVPTHLGQLFQLKWISLVSCDLTGHIPSELGQATMLQSIYLYQNSLKGTVPSELGHLVDLTFLDLTSNNLTGSVPDEICSIAGNSSDIYVYVDCELACACCEKKYC